ncbi:MAG: hypothetical protein QQN63_13520 [Nitrosopumilus sp.]
MIKGQSCGKCAYCFSMDDKTGTCRYDPPRTFMIPMKNSFGGGVQPVPTTAYPPVEKDDIGCGKFSPTSPTLDEGE